MHVTCKRQQPHCDPAYELMLERQSRAFHEPELSLYAAYRKESLGRPKHRW